MLPPRKATITITWDLDMVPGWNYDADDLRRQLEYDLNNSIPWYNPVVTVTDSGREG